jgi:hypothetical protein
MDAGARAWQSRNDAGLQFPKAFRALIHFHGSAFGTEFICSACMQRRTAAVRTCRDVDRLARIGANLPVSHCGLAAARGLRRAGRSAPHVSEFPTAGSVGHREVDVDEPRVLAEEGAIAVPPPDGQPLSVNRSAPERLQRRVRERPH